jgi:hypothetical protein
VLCLAGVSCSNWKMPKVEMPKMLQGETAEEKVRQRIADVVASPSDADYYKNVGALVERSRELGWDDPKLLAAVVDYYPSVEGTDKARVYQRLLETMRVSRSSMVEVAATRLDAGGQAAEINLTLLRWAAPPDPRGRADFSHFRSFLEARQAQPPEKLVVWMYDRDAAAALWEMATVYGPGIDKAEVRDVILSEHVVSEILFRQEHGLLERDMFDPAASAQLEKLSKSKRWWVRLYVAEIVSKYPKLQTGDVVDRLKADTNAMVARRLGGRPTPATQPAR